MRRRLIVTLAMTFALSVVMAVPVGAADLHDAHEDTQATCGEGYLSVWHFVNNQTQRSAAGALDVDFSDGNLTGVAPDKVNRNVQHWTVRAGGNAKLFDASTNLPGRLVLSDLSCEEDKK